MDWTLLSQWTLVLTSIILILTGTGSGHEHAHQAFSDDDKPTGFHDPRVVQDTEHIKEHYEGKVNFKAEEMTPEELEFHYFKLHDFDNNTKLDGLEIYKALTHLLPFEPENEDQYKPTAEHNQGKTKDQIESIRREDELNYYTEIVDTVFEEDDLDDDGYLEYAEYVFARKREEARTRAEQRREHEREHHRQERRQAGRN